MGMTALSLLVVGYLWISKEFQSTSQQSDDMKEQYLEMTKTHIKTEVDKVINYIAFRQSQTRQLLETMIRSRTYEAVAIGNHLYDRYKNKMPLNKIKEMVREALRPILYNNNRGYFFATELTGIEKLFADRPDLEEKNLIDMRDTNGKYVIRDMIAIAKEKKEGFYEYYWTKPQSQGKNYPKIAFIKYFEPFDWFIGTGDYLDNVEDDIKKESLNWINEIRFGKYGYVFVFSRDGTCVAHHQKKFIGKKFSQLLAADGEEKFKEVLECADKQDGGYVQYLALFKPYSQKPAMKLSYFKSLPVWNMIVGAGEYTNEMELIIDQNKKKITGQMLSNIRKIMVALLIISVFTLLISRYLSQRLKTSFQILSSFFQRAASESIEIDTNSLGFSEFNPAAQSANHMIKQRALIEENLKTTIDELKMMQDENVRLVMAVEQAAEIIVITDAEGNIQYVNPSFEQITGYKKNEAVGQNPRILKSGKQNTEFYKDFWDTITAGKVWRGQLINRKKDGSLYHEDASISPIRDTSGKITNYVAVKHDITTEIEMEKKLAQAHKMEAIGTLAGGIAHDFNNILSAIIGYSEMAIYDLEKNSLAAENIKQILTAGYRAKELVKQILSVSRINDDKKAPLRLSHIVKEAVKLLRASLPATIEIQLDLKTNEDRIMGDPVGVHQVLLNLCTNAAHAMEEQGGLLQIRLECIPLEEKEILLFPGLKPGNFIKLSIIDTGTGIPNNIIERIYDPYFTTKEHGKGTGLGLALVHSVVRSHSGSITVQSEPGKGTTFEVYFPSIEDDLPLLLTEAEPVPMATRHENILIVDDEPMLTDIASQMLVKLGYNVKAYNFPEEALKVFESDPDAFDLIITDMTMPKLTGDNLAQQIKRIRPDIPLILCTGYSEHITLKKASSAGINHFLMKPLTLHQVSSTVRDILDKK